MNAPGVIALAAVLAAECALLGIGQRRLFWLAVDATRSQLFGYLIAMPGTVLHEAAHYLMCVLLRVPVGGDLRDRDGRRARVKLFRPERDPDTGAVTLGSVPHAHTDPLRGALIAVAPLLLVPPLFVGVSVLLLGGHAWQDPLAALTGAAWWKVILWAYIAFSCGQASFPSPGDHVGALGGICLAATGVLAVWALLAHGGIGQLQQALTVVVQLMAVPAASAAAGFAVFWVLIRLRAGRH